jgi:hypothetical protein
MITMMIKLFESGKDLVFLITKKFIDIYFRPTHKDEMCNVYAMYSFEPTKTASGKQKTGAAPIRSCWDNEFSSLTKYVD